VSLRNEARQILALVFAGKSQDSFFGNSDTSPELARALDSQAPSGSFVSTVKQDGVERISAFQRVGNYPLFVILGEGTSSFLLPWREQVERIALLCLLGAATMAVLSVLVYFAIRRETGGRSNLEAALQRSQALMQASQDGVHVLDGSGTIVSASASLAAMLGYHTDYLQGHHLALLTALPLQALMPPEPEPEADTPDALRKLRTQYRRQDGSLLAVELYVSRLVDSTGALLYCSARDISPFLNTPQE
jgi:PAS domain S-box-containing protein